MNTSYGWFLRYVFLMPGSGRITLPAPVRVTLRGGHRIGRSSLEDGTPVVVPPGHYPLLHFCDIGSSSPEPCDLWVGEGYGHQYVDMRLSGLIQQVRLANLGQKVPGMPAEDVVNRQAVTRLGAGGITDEDEEDIREAYRRGMTAEQAVRWVQRVRIRRFDERWPPNACKPFMPTRAQVSWETRWVPSWTELRAPEAGLPRDRYVLRVGAWAQRSWWSWARRTHFRGESWDIIQVHLNGGGRDHELRFRVSLRPMLSWADGNNDELSTFGAANSFKQVDAELEEHFNGPGRMHRLGSRGLSAPKVEDVLTVMRWCDKRVVQAIDERRAP